MRPAARRPPAACPRHVRSIAAAALCIAAAAGAGAPTCGARAAPTAPAGLAGKPKAPKPPAAERHALRRAAEAATARALAAYRRKDTDAFIRCPGPAAPRVRTFRGDTIACAQLREQVRARMARAEVGGISVRIDSVSARGDTGVILNTQRFERTVRDSAGAPHQVVSSVRHRETWVRTAAGWGARFVEEISRPVVYVDGVRQAPGEGPAPRPAPRALDSAGVAALLDSVVPRAMRAEHIPGAVVSVVAGARVLFARGYGVADLDARRPVSPESTVFRIGSISKVFTATAVAQLADRGRVDLREDVNRYLRRLRVPATFPQPVTAWHLLTHTAALDEIRPGTQAERESELLPLDRFLRGKLVRLHPPGEVTSYSTYGITLAGLLVEEVSGLSFEEYLTRNVWAPLGMRHTSIRVPPEHARLVATAYDVNDSGRVVRAPWEWYHTTPASSVNSTAADMARFMAMHLQSGALAGARVLSPRMTAEVLRQQATLHPLVPGWALGWQQSRTNGERIAEHGGDVAGYSSLMFLLPERGVGVFVASHREGSDLRFVVRQAVLDRFFPDRAPPARPVPLAEATAERARRYAGRYRASIVCHSCRAPRPVPEATIAANADGTISLWNARWVEVSPGFFRSADGRRRVGFRHDRAGRVTHLTAGSWQVMERVR